MWAAAPAGPPSPWPRRTRDAVLIGFDVDPPSIEMARAAAAAGRRGRPGQLPAGRGRDPARTTIGSTPRSCSSACTTCRGRSRSCPRSASAVRPGGLVVVMDEAVARRVPGPGRRGGPVHVRVQPLRLPARRAVLVAVRRDRHRLPPADPGRLRPAGRLRERVRCCRSRTSASSGSTNCRAELRTPPGPAARSSPPSGRSRSGRTRSARRAGPGPPPGPARTAFSVSRRASAP